MQLPIPFPEDYKNKPFFYLRKKDNGNYDLYVAVLVSNNYEVALKYQTPQIIQSPLLGSLLDSGLVINPSSNSLGDRIETFAFNNITPPFTITGAQVRIQIIDHQLIDYDDADLNNLIYEDSIAVDCPYVQVGGMIIAAENTVRPKVIIPTRKSIQDITNSQNNQTRICTLTLSGNNQTSSIHWEYTGSLPEYTLAPNDNEGGFEAHTTNPNTRKTKVKNKNKTSVGGGGGSSLSWWERLKALWRRLVFGA